MKTVYYGLTERGEWVLFKSKQPVRNCKQASKIIKEEVISFKLAPIFYQIFQIIVDKQ